MRAYTMLIHNCHYGARDDVGCFTRCIAEKRFKSLHANWSKMSYCQLIVQYFQMMTIEMCFASEHL